MTTIRNYQCGCRWRQEGLSIWAQLGCCGEWGHKDRMPPPGVGYVTLEEPDIRNRLHHFVAKHPKTLMVYDMHFKSLEEAKKFNHGLIEWKEVL